MKKISIVTGCYNEEENVELLIEKVREVMAKLPEYTYEHIFIDNSSTDNTLSMMKELRSNDTRFHYISFSKNFGKDGGGCQGHYSSLFLH